MRRHSERHVRKPTDLVNPSCSAKAQATPCVATYIYRYIKLYTRTLHTSAGIFAQAPGPGYRIHNHRMASLLLCPAVLCIEYRRAGKVHHVFIGYTVVGEKVVGLHISPCGNWPATWSGWMHNEWRGAVSGWLPGVCLRGALARQYQEDDTHGRQGNRGGQRPSRSFAGMGSSLRPNDSGRLVHDDEEHGTAAAAAPRRLGSCLVAAHLLPRHLLLLSATRERRG